MVIRRYTDESKSELQCIHTKYLHKHKTMAFQIGHHIKIKEER